MRRWSTTTRAPQGGGAGPPTESTGMFENMVPRNYQSTETLSSSSARGRRRMRDGRVGAGNGSAAGAAASDQEGQGGETSGFRKFVARFQSVELENKGSTARDHLALERTFLAWLRTSLAFASIGIAITQLFRLNASSAAAAAGGDGADAKKHNSSMRKMQRLGKPLGVTFLGISIAILFLGYRRYLHGQEWLMKGKFPASRGTVLLVVLMAFSIMIVSLVVVVAVAPSSREL